MTSQTPQVADLPRACKIIATRANSMGVDINIQIMGESTRTAQDAALAVGTTTGQIVKSLIFRGRQSDAVILLLVSGQNRVNEKAVAQTIGEKISRPDAEFVRSQTGFAIGGIPPLGFETQPRTYIDQDLLAYETVYAAGGTPKAIFAIDPAELMRVTSAISLSVSS